MTSRDPRRWEQRYVDGDLPWDTGSPDVHLQRVMERHSIRRGAALDIGCGTGTNAIWLAEQGFAPTGLDLSDTAIAMARAKAASAGVDARFLAADFLQDPAPSAPHAFIYDRGCFHVFPDAEVRSRFASRVAAALAPDGIWHSLIGSTEGPPRDTGPPRLSAAQVVQAVEPHLRILELSSTVFDLDDHRRAAAWILVAQAR